MTDLYKALNLSQSSTVDELQKSLATLLRQARYDLAIANDDVTSENAENRIVLIHEAQKQFATQESKIAYDNRLANDRQATIGKKVREHSKYGGPDEALLDLLKEAVEKDDYSEVKSLSREFQLRNCESAAFYRYIAEAYAKQQELQAAWDLVSVIADKFGDDGIEETAEACVAIAENGLKDNGDLFIVRKALDYALKYDDYLRGQAEALDIQWDLYHDNEAMAIQKARTTSAQHPGWIRFRSCAAADLIDYAEGRYIKKDQQMKPYYDSKEDYQNFSRVLHLASDIYPDTDPELRQYLDTRVANVESMVMKKVIPGGWWAISFPIVMGGAMLVQPFLRIFSYILIAIGIGFFFGLRIPKYMLYKYNLKKELDGIQEVIRIISKVSEWSCKLLFWPVTLLLKYAPRFPE